MSDIESGDEGLSLMPADVPNIHPGMFVSGW